MNCKALKIIIFLLIVIMFGIGSFFIIRGLTMEDDKKDDKRSFSSVDTLKITGQLMSPLLKETSLGGLAKTKTAQELEKKLFKNKH